MRSMSIAAGALIVLLSTSCGGGGGGVYGPTEREINDSLQAILNSAAGDWTGVTTMANPISLDFKLQEGSNGQLTGAGTMKEGNAAAAVPITVTGTFNRPLLTLSFTGIVYESQQVNATAQGNYTTVGGIGTNLVMTAPGYSRQVAILLQEKP